MDRTPRFTIAPDDELQLSAAQVEAILSERAAKLAITYAPSSYADIEQVHLIAFSRGDHRYGIELAYLAEIRPVTRCTPVPGVPPPAGDPVGRHAPDLRAPPRSVRRFTRKTL